MGAFGGCAYEDVQLLTMCGLGGYCWKGVRVGTRLIDVGMVGKMYVGVLSLALHDVEALLWSVTQDV